MCFQLVSFSFFQRTEEGDDQAAVNDDSVSPDQETVTTSGAVSVDHEVDKIVTSLGDLPGNVEGLHVEILDSVNCYGRYMGFPDEAVTHSINKPGEVDLYISSAPHIHTTTLYDVIKHIEPLDQTNFKCVTFFFRHEDFNTVIGSEVDSMIWTVFQTKIRNGKYKVYVSTDKYFHTKWCAYAALSDCHVTTLFTSANLTTDHLKPLRCGQNFILNSIVTDTMEVGFFENCVLNPQRSRCSKVCDSIRWDWGSKVHIPDYSDYQPPDPRPRQRSDIPRNMSSKLIFQNVVNFIEIVKSGKKGKKSDTSGGNHYIYMVSPFIVSKNGDSSIIEKLYDICCRSDGASSSDQADLVTKVVHCHDNFSQIINEKLAKIAEKMETSPMRNKFHCKFIAWVQSDADEVRILQTSANFNSENMTILPTVTRGSFSNLEWIVEHTVTEATWNGIKQLIGFNEV